MTITAGASRVASGLLCLHAIAIIPAGPMKLIRSSLSIVSGLPCEKVRSAPAIVISGPAQRSLKLRPARSRSRLATLSIESSDSFVASTIVSIATGWSEPVPGRELHPLKSSAFSRRTFSQFCDHYDVNQICDSTNPDASLQVHDLDGTPFPGNIIPADKIDPSAPAILQYYPLPIQGGVN